MHHRTRAPLLLSLLGTRGFASQGTRGLSFAPPRRAAAPRRTARPLAPLPRPSESSWQLVPPHAAASDDGDDGTVTAVGPREAFFRLGPAELKYFEVERGAMAPAAVRDAQPASFSRSARSTASAAP